MKLPTRLRPKGDDAASAPAHGPGDGESGAVLDRRSVPAPWGPKVAGGGRLAHVEASGQWQATTVQACGLFPFVAGSGSPVVGVPVGRHMDWGEVVCLDPLQWLEAGLVDNPGMWIQAQPGVGKSALVKRLMRGMAGFGITTLVLGDTKPDYPAVVDRLGGQVIQVGRGMDRINPLDAGPLGTALARLPATERTTVAMEVRGRRLGALLALLTLVRRGRDIANVEEGILGRILDVWVDTHPPDLDPTVPDVLAMLREGPEVLWQAAEARTDDEWRTASRELIYTLALLCGGTFAGVFDAATTTPIDLAAPAVSVDISRVAADDTLVAATMLSTWSYGFGVVDAAHVLSDAGLAPPRRFFAVLDELWRALRGSPGLVERADALTRLNRAKGMAHAMITHSLSDLTALPTEADRKKAGKFMDRCHIKVLGGLPPGELDEMERSVRLTRLERDKVTSWCSAPTLDAGCQPSRPGQVPDQGRRRGRDPRRAHLRRRRSRPVQHRHPDPPRPRPGGARRDHHTRARRPGRSRPGRPLGHPRPHGHRRLGGRDHLGWRPGRHGRDRYGRSGAAVHVRLGRDAGHRRPRRAVADHRHRPRCGSPPVCSPPPSSSLVTLAVVAWSGRRAVRAAGTADADDVAALAPKAAAARARQLRPSLADRRRLDPCEVGVPLGRLAPAGPVLRASWEDVSLAVMAPRAGKTTALAVPAVLDAPGPVVATSNKVDLWAATATLRGEVGPVWTFDPQHITGSRRPGWWWNPLARVTTVEAAHRLAGHFVTELGDDGKRDFWVSAAHDLLTGMLLAAGVGDRTLADVYRWLTNPVATEPVDLLVDAGHAATAAVDRVPPARRAGNPRRDLRKRPHRRPGPARRHHPGLGHPTRPRPMPQLDLDALVASTASAVPDVQGRRRRRPPAGRRPGRRDVPRPPSPRPNVPVGGSTRP